MLLIFLTLGMAQAAILPPPWADPAHNPCAVLPGGWQLLFWPADGRCYRIFTTGPCPESMELAPGLTGEAECHCPPGSSQTNAKSLCYQLFTRGPCSNGSYFAPIPDKPGVPYSRRRGYCQEIETCTKAGYLFWPQSGQCYMQLSRGPCPKGELLIKGEDGELPRCHCESSGVLKHHYWIAGQSCHEHYTRGPCLEHGSLFLPGGICGCHEGLPHFHAESGRCYQLGGTDPCPTGHQFLVAQGREHAICMCKEGYVLWPKDGACYRLYTQGPCPDGHLFFNSTTCIPLPCRHGRLYFPEENGCYKVGLRGPCPTGQIVLFENSVRPSVDGISYRGMCGCSGSQDCLNSIQCDSKMGMIKWNGTCFALYTRGPCSEYEWLVPEREGKLLWTEHGWKGKQTKAKCECRPGHKPQKNSSQCQPPTVALATFLNQNYYPSTIPS